MPQTKQAREESSPEPLPDWVDDTPYETYEIEMFDSNGECLQHIDLDRNEFIELKAHLAKMRGYKTDAA